MATNPPIAPAANPADAQKLVLNRYQERIQYYWSASRGNKRWYKLTRILTVVLGAAVTLISSLASASFVKDTGWLQIVFAVTTPLCAASLAIVGGFSQSFQWGATWSDMVITAERLECEKDRISVTPPDQIDAVKEMVLLDQTVLAESQGFFQRLFGSAASTKPPSGGEGA